MQATALNQPWLRQQSGHGKGGRPTEQCVMAISLSWHPEQQPEAEHMREAARDFLQRMGWGDHQALLVAHNDTAHRHVHIILNTIHPETGMTLDRNWSKIRASEWRMEFERAHGQVYTRAPGQSDGPTLHHGEWQAWRDLQQEGRVTPEYAATLHSGEWQTLKQHQRQERITFWKQSTQARRELRCAVREEVKAEFAPAWQHYAEGRDQRRQEAQHYDREARRALQHYRRFGPLHGIDAPRQVRERQRAYHERRREALASKRAALSAAMKERTEQLTAQALARLAMDRAALYEHILHRHRGERAELHRDQAEGTRRPDLLAQEAAPQGAVLSLYQIKAYKEQAIAAVARDQALQQARPEVTRARGAEATQAVGDKRTEQTDRKQQARPPVDAETWRHAAELARALAQRREQAGRDGGGRDGGGRER
jgi:hypothetical protein